MSYKVTSLEKLTKLQPTIENVKRIAPKTSDLARNFSDFVPLENINTDNIIQYTDSTGYSTYTFKIIGDENSINFENFHLLETDEGFIGYILSYEPDEDWYYSESNFTPEGDWVFNIATYQGYLTKYSLEREVIWSSNPNMQNPIANRNQSITYNRASFTICTIFVISTCSNIYSGNPYGYAHPMGPNCEGPYGFMDVETCTTYSGGGSSGGNNGGSSGDNDDDCDTTGTRIVQDLPLDGIDSGCTPNDNTGILPPVEETEEDLDHCEKLLALNLTDSLSVNIVPYIDSLRTKTSLDKEYSISFQKKYNYGEFYSLPDPVGIREGQTTTSSSIRIGSTWFGQAHTHPDGTHYMFSWNDINKLNMMYKGLNDFFDKNEVFMMIVNHDGTVYALKINNANALNTEVTNDLFNAEGNSLNEKVINLNLEIQNEFEEDEFNLEHIFLKRFEDFGLAIYKAANNSLSNWNKLELNPNLLGPNVIEIPCN